jgi:dolichol-phosphate mannosyltransferase
MLSDSDKNKIMILIPSLSPEKELITYIEELIQNNYKNIIVVNDGSSREYNKIFEEIENKQECTVLKHETNFGKGEAIKTGLEYFKKINSNNSYIGIITVDSDGQHLVKDVTKVAEAMKENPNSLILGTRDFSDSNVPPKSSFGNKITSNVFKILYGAKISDTQTGLRGIPSSLAQEFSHISGNRFEYETNMLIECILNKIEIMEEPITTVYINNNSETHFRPIHDSISIYWKILNSFIKYSAVSLISCCIDILLFELILVNLKFNLDETVLIAISTVLARIVSSLVNYTLNKKFSFNSQKNVKSTIIKYYILCIIQMIASATCVSIIYYFIKIPEVIIKVIVDTIIFFINYRIQRVIIFNK